MRIALLSPAYVDPRKSQSQFLHERTLAYMRRGHQVCIFTGAERADSYSVDGVDVFRGPVREATPRLKEFDPDVLAIHQPFRGFQMDLAQNVPVPKVVWIHGAEALFPARYYHFYLYPGDIGRIPRWLKEDITQSLQILALRRFLSRCDAAVFVSGWMRWAGEFYLRFRHPRTYVIPNPVDLDLFRFRRREHAQAALSLRGLSHKYGVDLAIRAFAKISGAELTVVGSGELERYLRRLAARLDAPVRFEVRPVPHREIPRVLDSHDFFVAPSRTEAQGVSMCEAMAAGMPVVASRAGGIPEFVRDGRDGFLSEPNDARELRKAIESLRSSPERIGEMSESASRYVGMKCGPANTVHREMELLTQVADSGES